MVVGILIAVKWSLVTSSIENVWMHHSLLIGRAVRLMASIDWVVFGKWVAKSQSGICHDGISGRLMQFAAWLA